MAPKPEKHETTRQQLLRHLARWDQRLRLTQTTLWVPRGLAAGLVIGLVVALISRLRPWLLPNQILAVTLVATVFCGMVALVVVWAWPRPPLRAARNFDRLFGLKERSSTALEIDSGTIKAPAVLVALQAQDTLRHAASIVPRRYLRFQWRRYELMGLGLLFALLALTFLFANPQAQVIAQQRAVQSAIENQLRELEEIKRQIESNPLLSDEEKQKLSQILEDTGKRLEQPNITQPEAVAELAKASEQINNARSELTQQQREAARLSGQALNQSQVTQDIGQALQQGRLGEGAEQMENLSQRLEGDQLTPEQQREAADALEAAAQTLAEVNPKAAEALQRAAEALRNGNLEEAAKALREAAQALREQETQMNQSPLNQAAQQAIQQLNQGRQEVAQAGQQPQQGDQGQQSQSLALLEQSGQQGQMLIQPGQQGQESQQGQMGIQPEGQSEQPGDTLSLPQGGEQGSQPGSRPGQQAGEGNAAGAGTSGNVAGAQGGEPGAGTGSGGSGRDIIEGDPNYAPIDPRNERGDGRLSDNEFIYAPSFIGGEGGPDMNLRSGAPPSETDPGQSGNFVQNPDGETRVRVGSVVGLAAKQADLAMDNDRVPGALRGVIREYFTGLQQ